MDTPRVDARERDRLGERARPLNLEQSGRAISARTRRPVSIVVGFCDRAADGQPPEARQIRATAPRLSRRRDRRRKVKRGREKDRIHSRRLSADRAARSRPVEARGSQQRKTKEGAKPVEDRSRRRSRPRTSCSLTPCILPLACAARDPHAIRDPRSDPRRVRDPANSYTRHGVVLHQGYTIGPKPRSNPRDFSTYRRYLFLPAPHRPTIL